MYVVTHIHTDIYIHIFYPGPLNANTSCDELSTPVNGEITLCSSGTVGVGYEGDNCSFTCSTGYELTGSDTRTCQSNGRWSGSDVVCSRGNV